MFNGLLQEMEKDRRLDDPSVIRTLDNLGDLLATQVISFALDVNRTLYLERDKLFPFPRENC